MGLWLVFEKDEKKGTREQIGKMEFSDDGAFDIFTNSESFVNFMEKFSVALEDYTADRNIADLLSAENLIDLEMLVATHIGQKSQWRYIIEPCVTSDEDVEPA